MASDREALIRSANAEILGQGNIDAADEVFTSGYLAHGGGKDFTGLAFIRQWIGQLRAAIEKMQVVDVTIFAESGDTVAWQRTLRGVHTANLMGVPASGKTVEWREMLVSRFEGAKIAEEWVVSELAGELLIKQPRG
jgi:predicted ester cyclase